MRSWAVLAASSAIFIGALSWSASRPVASDALHDVPIAQGNDGKGAAAFYGDDFGGLSLATLSTNAVPLRISAAALVLDARQSDTSMTLDQAGYERVMRSFGLVTPKTIENFPSGPISISPEEPLGITHGAVRLAPGMTIEVANLGCAACHSGLTYDRNGSPITDRVWLGQPNSSLDLQRYTDAILRGLRAMDGRDGELVAAAALIGPPMPAGERWTLQHVVLPMMHKRLGLLKGAEHALPFPNGWPGATNGVAALKNRLHTPMIADAGGDAGSVSIPDLGNRDWRTSMLTDGAYSIGADAPSHGYDLDDKHLDKMATAMTFFTVPSMGVRPDDAIHKLPTARMIVSFLQGRRRQLFPVAIDKSMADRGYATYRSRCASCHGTMTREPRPIMTAFPNMLADVGTDTLRARAFDPRLAEAVRTTSYGKQFATRSTGRYAAPPLAGLWSSAPYLHNGSVPTLEALLDPQKRPTRFMIGGHELDMKNVGVRLEPDGRYPKGYRPWSMPQWYDVRDPGHGNQGHLYGADLNDKQRGDLIEYLKTL